MAHSTCAFKIHLQKFITNTSKHVSYSFTRCSCCERRLTFGTNSSKRMDVVFVDELFLQDHLHRNNDLSQDDQKVSCRTEESSCVYFTANETLHVYVGNAVACSSVVGVSPFMILKGLYYYILYFYQFSSCS